MKTALGSAGGLFIAALGSFGLFVLLLVAKQVSQDLAMALFKEALKAGWFDGTRRCRADQSLRRCPRAVTVRAERTAA